MYNPDNKVHGGRHGAHLGPVGPRCAPCWHHKPYYQGSHLGAVSIRKTVLPGMAIPMLKIRRPNGRLILTWKSPYVDKTVFILRRGPELFRSSPMFVLLHNFKIINQLQIGLRLTLHMIKSFGVFYFTILFTFHFLLHLPNVTLIMHILCVHRQTNCE